MSCCGLDFGTSNTTLALVSGGDVRPILLDQGHDPPEATPTVLYFPGEGARFYGTRAIHEYVDRAMTGRFIQSIKRYLPSKTFDHTVIDGQRMDLPALIGGFMKHVRDAAEALAGERVDKVVLGRPAVFHRDPARDALAQGRLEAAARAAGFQELRFRIEPIAAARAFERRLDRETLCLVGDLGGGTSDFTMMRLGPQRVGRADRRDDILGSDGIDVAGNDFDALLVRKKVLPTLGGDTRYRPMGRWVPVPTRLHVGMTGWHALSFLATRESLEALDGWIRTAEDPDGLSRLREVLTGNYGFALFRAVERAKVALSRSDSTRLRFHEGGVNIDEPVSRAEFEEMCRPLLERLAETLDGLLREVAVAPEQVSAVFLTGGTSLIPCVREIFEARFPGRVLGRDAFTSVGLGLGVEAAEVFGAPG